MFVGVQHNHLWQMSYISRNKGYESTSKLLSTAFKVLHKSAPTYLSRPFYHYTFLFPNNLHPSHAEFLNIEWHALLLYSHIFHRLLPLSGMPPSIAVPGKLIILQVLSVISPPHWRLFPDSLLVSHSFLYLPTVQHTSLLYHTLHYLKLWAFISLTRPMESSHLILCCISNTSCG